jgi:peptidoglycan-associated lipoprotein
MSPRFSALVLMLAAIGVAAGCRQKPVQTVPQPEPTTAPAEPAPAPSQPSQTVTDFPAERGTASDITDPSIDQLNASGVLKTVYFDYDQDALTDEARATLQENAKWLREHPGYRIRIEGNADDRGTIEYNLALGQRRADSVREYLGSLGVTTTNIEVISYGEEKPAVDGSDESSWSRNRRADFVIVAKS